MSTTKITDLPILTTPTANSENTVFVVVDKSSGIFTTKQLSLANLDSFVDNVGPVAFAHANGAFTQANLSNVLAQSAFNAANSANTFDFTNISITAGAHGNAIFVPIITLTSNGRVSSISNTAITGFANTTYDQAGFDKANSANVLAQTAFDKANNDNTTTISTTAGVYGNSTFVPVITLAANGRVSLVTNTAITGFANATYDQVGFDHANGAFTQANSANSLAQAAFNAANTANGIFANAAFNQANSANILAQAAFNQANSANVLAQNAFNAANSANTFDYTTISTTAGVYGNATFVPVITLAANGRISSITNTEITGFANATYDQVGFDHANGAFIQANSANSLAQNAYNHANTISITLSNAFITASRNTANSAYDHANGAFIQANTGLSLSASAFNAGNTAQVTAAAGFNHANGAFTKANSANILAQSSFDASNTTNSIVTLSYIHANGAFDKANSANILAQAAFNQANTSNTTADAAFAKANSANVIAQSSYDFANTVNTFAYSAYATTNTNTATISNVSIHANGAYDTANTALATAAIAINFDNNSNAAFDKANSANVIADAAFAKANSANVIADAAFAKANSANVLAQDAFTAANSANTFDFTNISTTAGVYGNATFVPVITLAANGRISSITNTAITGLSANAAFDHANGAFTAANVTLNIALSFSSTTILDVTANSSIAYLFTQYDGINNPNISTFSATTLGFNLDGLAGSHPFHIRLGDNSADFNTGLVHVSTAGILSYNTAAQGQTSGTLFWRIPHTSVGNYKYRCSAHPSVMIGEINIANTANIYFAYNT